jgi:phage terminase large subunit-like protein
MFDPWGGMIRSAEVLSAQNDLTCVEVRQNISGLTAATKEFLALYMSGDLIHGNNPVMNWNVSCLSLESDHNHNVKPCKPKRDSGSKRIDLVSAAINAMARATYVKQESVYATRGPLVIATEMDD